MKNKIFIILAFAFISLTVKGQQFPLLSTYDQNLNLVNPAKVSESDIKASVFYRNMWTGYDEAPKSFGANVLYKHNNINLGVFFLNDKAGVFNQNVAHVSYSYRMDVSKKLRLSYGVSGGFNLFAIKFNELRLHDENDPLLQTSNGNSMLPDFNIGIVLSSKPNISAKYLKPSSFYAGISVQHLLGVVLDNEIARNDSYLKKHFNLIGGYRHFVSKDIELEEDILMKYIPDVPFQADIGLKMIYNSHYKIGVSYRTSNDVIFKLEIAHNIFTFGYAYDYSIDRNINKNSNEVFLTYKLQKRSASKYRD